METDQSRRKGESGLRAQGSGTEVEPTNHAKTSRNLIRNHCALTARGTLSPVDNNGETQPILPTGGNAGGETAPCLTMAVKVPRSPGNTTRTIRGQREGPPCKATHRRRVVVSVMNLSV